MKNRIALYGVGPFTEALSRLAQNAGQHVEHLKDLSEVRPDFDFYIYICSKNEQDRSPLNETHFRLMRQGSVVFCPCLDRNQRELGHRYGLIIDECIDTPEDAVQRMALWSSFWTT